MGRGCGMEDTRGEGDMTTAGVEGERGWDRGRIQGVEMTTAGVDGYMGWKGR